MALLVLLSLLTGMVLGLRFKVLVLVPAIACVLVAALGIGIARGAAFWPAVIGLAGVASVQIGYLAGVGIRHLLAAARMSGLRNASVAGPQPVRRTAH